MKKIFSAFLFFVLCSSMNAQQYSFKLIGEVYHEGDACADTNMAFYVYYEGDTERTLVGNISDGALDFPEIITTRKIVAIETSSNRRIRVGIGVCRRRGNSDVKKNIDNNCHLQTWIQSASDSEIIYNSNFYGSLTVEYYPLIIIDKGLNETPIAYESDHTVTATPGFDPNAYQWQYQPHAVGAPPVDSKWIDLPAPSIQHELVFNPSDYINETAFDSGLNQVAIRLGRCGMATNERVSHPVWRAAPYILPNFSITEPTCYGDNDGSITLNFSRDLLPGESLGLRVRDLANGGVSLILDGRFNDIRNFETNRTLTITGLPKSGAGFQVIIIASNLFTDGSDHILNFDMGSPDVVAFTDPTSTDVNCNGGSDGTISFTASGGNIDVGYEYRLYLNDALLTDWTAFSNGISHTRGGLAAGEYKIRVRDLKGCMALEVSDVDNDGILNIGDEIVKTVVISEPTVPLNLVFEDSNDASSAGFTDGSISVRVFGGTPNPDSSYNVTWKNESGTVLTSVDAQVIAEGYFVTLRDIGAGNYFVSVTDANHNAATQKESCEISDTGFSISEPPPLTATMEETDPISCNSTNVFNDPFSDGELVAHAKGGVQLGIFDNNGLPYYYTWKKDDGNGIFQVLTQENDSILSNISVGRYSVNVEDANGIIIGEYVNNVLVNPLDVVHDLKEPDPITIVFDKNDIGCNGGNEGWAKAFVSGGTGAYDLKWSNGVITDRIENLESGTYLLFVTDEKGCEATAQVSIGVPNALSVSITEQKDPSCNNGADGAITLLVSGGLAPYSYRWNTGDTDASLEGLDAGTYSVAITDTNLCAKTMEIVLRDPDPDLIDLGIDRVLCGGQSIFLDATFGEEGTGYEWTSDNGFSSTSAMVEVSEAGTYSVSITTPLGCSGGDTVVITTSDTEIDAHFVVSTQAFAGEELALVNISSPLGDTVEWFFPPEATVVAENDETVILLFNTSGTYDVILRSYQGECYLDFMKSVIIGEAENIPDIGDAEAPFIQEFIVYPNPSNGKFKVDIGLTEASDISLKLFSMASRGLVNERKGNAAATYSMDYGVALASGSYLLLLETAKGSEIRKILIK